jgi:chromosome segregation ATPase
LTSDITSLEEAGTAIKAVIEAYKEALPNLWREDKEDEAYAETEMRMVLCAVEKNKPKIDQKIAEYDGKIAQKTAALEELKSRKLAAEQALKQANDDEAAKQTQYDHWSGLEADIKAKLLAVTKLKELIETAHEANHAASMYFLTLELQRTLHSIKIVCTEDLKNHLYQASDELSKAKEVVRQKESELATATTELSAAQTELDDLKTKRQANILALLEPFDVPAQPKNYQGAKKH